MRRYVTEAIGTFFLVFTVVTTVLLSVALAPFAIAAALVVMVYAGGHVSGAHYNPAVSLAAAVRGRLPWRDVPAYCTAQVVGAVLAAGAGRFIADKGAAEAFSVSGRDAVAAGVAELIVTFALAYVVLNAATSRDTDGNSFYGLAIGGTVLAGALTVGSVSGGAFNPAVGLGACLVGLVSWGMLPLYLVANLAAGAAAGLAYRALNPDDVREAEPVVDPAAAELARVAQVLERLAGSFDGAGPADATGRIENPLVAGSATRSVDDVTTVGHPRIAAQTSNTAG